METRNGVLGLPPIDREPGNLTRRSALGATVMTAFGASATLAHRVGSAPARPSVSMADRGIFHHRFRRSDRRIGGRKF